MELGANSNDLDKRRQLEALKKDVLSKYLTRDARERLSTLRYGHPELADSVEGMIVQAALSGQLKGVIDGEKLKNLLKAIDEEKHKPNIRW